MSNTLTRLVLAAALLLPVATARAADPSTADAAPSSAGGYRLQTFAVDASSLALFMGGQYENSTGSGRSGQAAEELMLSALGGYLLGGPLVHAAHRNGGRAIGDFFLRAALPVLGAVIGHATVNCDGVEAPCAFKQAATGFVIGAAAASVVDVALLSGFGFAPPSAERPSPRASSSWTLAPSVAASSTLALVGVGGQF